MKYVVLVSHGMFAPGLHSALDMLAGEGREDILSASLENGMSSDVYAENLRKRLEVVKPEDEILLHRKRIYMGHSLYFIKNWNRVFYC